MPRSLFAVFCVVTLLVAAFVLTDVGRDAGWFVHSAV